MNKIDLHMHSTVSDGALSPSDLVAEAHRLGLEIIAITDHDAVDAVAPAQETGKHLGMEVLSGVELSVIWNEKSIEILGYDFNPESRGLVDLLRLKKENRIERARQTVEKLSALGLPLSFERVLEIGGPGSVGRPHIAQAMVEAGYVQETKEAFNKYLGTGKPGYVKGGSETSLGVGILAVHQAGGVAVIAHPIIPGVPDYLDLEKILPDALEAGIDGIEAYYTGYTPETTERIRSMAAEHYLIVTGGSDFHGGNINPHLRLGEVNVPYSCVVGIRERAAQVREGM